MKQPIVAGIVGGVASGKSEVTRHLERLGARVIHADTLGHEVLKEAHVIETLTNRFGKEILDPATGQIERASVAKLVFGSDPQATSNRKFLESVVHPRIRKRIREALDSALADSSLEMVVLDVPLLIESGWIDSCDRVVFVDAPFEVRRARGTQRGWSDEQFRARESSQVDIDKKRDAATDRIDNAGTLEELRGQVERWWDALLASRRP
jgi:dephospho-CoA kinase